ncbi:MAG TPA: tetratricopeptide repeat protein [Pyrinomonadaceae bacterium]|nr:tetratricopeptide repeat protein [Pyrinomonadaceae bacterium]
MAFEKAKVLKNAEKFLSQGKINSAIKEYRQIVDHDANDLTTLNMLGDLCVRAGKKEEAVSCFDRIAEHYREQEFHLKAIAMYKKIERLKTRDPDVALKLADLYATQGLVVDARAQYLIVADAHTRTGQNKKALDILHKIADLDPNNTEIRLKLADGYLKEGMRREAATAFVQAANRLYQTGAFERALDAFNRALELTPDDHDALAGVLDANIARGTADQAAEVLEKVVETRQDDGALVAMLTRAYVESEDAKGAERATNLLMAQDAANYIQYLAVARLYLKAGELDETVRILGGVIERMLAGREEKDLLEIVHSVLEQNPDHVGALRMLVRIHWWQRDMDALRSVLERLAESAEAAELVEEERYALTQLVRLAPDEPRYLARLKLIGGLQEETVDDFAVPPEPVLPPPVGEVPEFETFAVVEETLAETPEAPTPVVEKFEFEANTVAAPAPSDPTASFADLNDITDSAGASFQEVDFETVSVVDEPVAPSAATEEGRVENMMRQELESVDFYIAQGYTDIALDTLGMLERQFGPHEEIKARREKLGASDGKAKEAAAGFEFAAVEEQSHPSTRVEPDLTFASIATEPNEAAPASAAASGIDAGLAELFEEFRLAEEESDVVAAEDFETHYNMGTAYKEMDLLDEAIQEFQTSASLVKASDGTSRFLQCCNMLGHCFIQKGLAQAAIMWFQKGLDAPGHSEQEYLALRYELASAHEQQGNFDRARQLYMEVYGTDISYREVAEKLEQLRDKGGKKKKK